MTPIRMEILTFNDEQSFIDATLAHIISLNPKTVALSGGSTPGPIYKALSKTSLRPTYFQVDERYVPHDHKDSNYKMITEAGLQLTYFDTSLPIKDSLKDYAKKLPEAFDLIILGIGPDGHTASLFPHSKALKTQSPVAHTQTTKFAIKDRLTITFPTIMKAKNLLVLLKGKDAKIIEMNPAAKLLKHNNLKVHCLR